MAAEGRETLAPLLIALDASPGTLRRDECGDYRIDGRWGHIYPFGAPGVFQVFVLDEKPEHGVHSRWTKLGWTYCKRALSFMTVVSDGDLEGAFRLDRLPTPEEAVLIRRYVGIRQKAHYSEESLAKFKERGQALQAAFPRKTGEDPSGE